MRYALQLAARGLGRTFPNPAVGCILVKDGQVIGAGRTADGGRPHAETAALTQAGALAQNATAYVTLEPCAHYGKTPPCAEALIQAGISRVVIACSDPDPRVNGKGASLLRHANIEVTYGVCEQEALALNAGFFSRIQKNLPLVSLKVATSLDGMVAAANGQSQWITGKEAREYGHLLRSRYDAILTGIGTVLKDDPALTCRLPGLEEVSPVRIILDSNLQLPLDSQLVKTAQQVPVWVFTLQTQSQKHQELEAVGVRVFAAQANAHGKICLDSALRVLASEGITRVLCEAGAALNGAMLESGHISKLYWFRAPIILGGKALPVFQGDFCPQNPGDLPRMECVERFSLDKDVLEIYSIC